MKLTLEHLAPYLPYKLNFVDIADNEVYELNALYDNGDAFNWDSGEVDLELIKPILRPLSDLTKTIEHNGKKFVPVEHYEIGDDDSGYHIEFGNGNVKLINDLEFCAKHNDWHDLQFVPAIVQKQLIKWHFDVFGLIEKGLAVDINEIEKQ